MLCCKGKTQVSFTQREAAKWRSVMINLIRKNAVVMLLAMGILFTTMAPGAMAQDRCRTRSRQVAYNNYDDTRRYDDRYDDRYDNRRNNEYYDDRSYNDGSKGRAVRRVGIGAAGGAIAGGLIGGRKGVLIGGIAGAAGGYLYHRNKENNRRY
jgi:hypothetical protein